MNSTDRIHIALSPWDLTDDYNQHAGVTLYSILEHSATPVVAHILYDERLCAGKEKETAYNKNCYQKIADRYGCELVYHHVEVPSWVTDLHTVRILSPGALLRLHLPELLPDINKIIYFDCDLVINTDIGDLWDIPLNNMLLGACLDSCVSYMSPKHIANLGISRNIYFNDGVLLINLQLFRMKCRSFTKIAYQYLLQHPETPFLDQDILNWYCQGNYLQLNQKYNIFSDRSDAIKYANDGIIHYVGRKKPWAIYSGNIDDYYWKYVVQTPWLDNPDKLVNAIRMAPDVSYFLQMLQTDFLFYLSGSRFEKCKYVVKFILSIFSSCIRSFCSR